MHYVPKCKDTKIWCKWIFPIIEILSHNLARGPVSAYPWDRPVEIQPPRPPLIISEEAGGLLQASCSVLFFLFFLT